MPPGDIDVKHMSSSIRPARKRGRPRNAAKALINDESIDVMALKPGNWKNTYVRHPQYLNGMCVDYRVVPVLITRINNSFDGSVGSRMPLMTYFQP